MNYEYEKQGTEIFGIKFAPLFIPWHRRFETISLLIAYVCGIYMIPLLIPIICAIIYLIIYTHFKYIAALYVCWYIYDRNTPYTGGRDFRLWYISPILEALTNYFPAELVKTVDLPPNTNYLFGVFPHGIITHGVQLNFVLNQRFHKLFPDLKLRIMALPAFFVLPIIRESFLFNGVSASNKENILHHLNSKQKNNVVILLVGGVAESLLTKSGTNKVIINNRKGFVRLALESGSSLVPVYTFGENEVMEQYHGNRIEKVQNFVRKFTGIPPFLLKGRGIFQYTFGMFAHRRRLTTVVGKPIPVPKVENPTDDQVDEYHRRFKEDLIELFESNKEKYDINGKEAELICL